MAIWVSAVGAPQIQPLKHVTSPEGCWHSPDSHPASKELGLTAAPEPRLLGSRSWLLILCMGGTAWLLVAALALSLYHRAHSAPIAKAAISAPEVRVNPSNSSA